MNREQQSEGFVCVLLGWTRCRQDIMERGAQWERGGGVEGTAQGAQPPGVRAQSRRVAAVAL